MTGIDILKYIMSVPFDFWDYLIYEEDPYTNAYRYKFFKDNHRFDITKHKVLYTSEHIYKYYSIEGLPLRMQIDLEDFLIEAKTYAQEQLYKQITNIFVPDEEED